MSARPLAILATLTVFTGLALEATGQTVQSFHCLASCPNGAPATNTLLIREIYALSNNPETKFADWVAYEQTVDANSSPYHGLDRSSHDVSR